MKWPTKPIEAVDVNVGMVLHYDGILREVTEVRLNVHKRLVGLLWRTSNEATTEVEFFGADAVLQVVKDA